MQLRFRTAFDGEKDDQFDWFERACLLIHVDNSWFVARDVKTWFLKWVFK